ncbi:MAG: NAD-dependent epimerase/dehydratase family protein [Advenella sp.]|uniref:NAD-dependent epimerase/dehydratase family protein n=1 Tax=Advenella sp. TaxID=1872388 RepID=UPI0025877D0A|nr:NAD-dependent epimerase/dehydratase family protein [Advenella sp.]MDD3759101.1 NAD-dependent epimerase/dehydratase family protein [Advenella sp.]
MKVLVCGAKGFIGENISRALKQAGHEVIAGISARHAGALPNSVVVDYAKDTTPQAWLPRLDNVDAVINAVGVLRTSRNRPIDAVHQHAPIALWDACALANIKKVIQISALGSETSETQYARTKRAADHYLMGLADSGKINHTILRPSIVFGKGGASSGLFMNLARLPLLLLPKPVLHARVQPVSVLNLAEAVVALLGPALVQQGIISCTGAEPVLMSDFIASLRQQCGKNPARVLPLPDSLSILSARLGDLAPGIPWCTETMTMLATNNEDSCADFEALIGHTPMHYGELVSKAWNI